MAYENILQRFTSPRINNLLAKAKITEVPLIVVEGGDDIQFYDRLAKICNKKINVKPVETIDSYSEGCEEVINLVKDIQDTLADDESYLKYFLGIIDKDIRDLRNSLPDHLLGLFSLNFYSLESHFISKYFIKEILYKITKVNEDLVTSSLIDLIYENANNNTVNFLKNVTLDCILNSLDPSYNAKFSFDQGIEQLFHNDVLRQEINNMEEELIQESIRLGFYRNIDLNFLKLYTKGKWLLKLFYINVFDEIGQLPSKCKGKTITQCQYCETNKDEKCLYGLYMNHQRGSFHNYVLKNFLDKEEVSYICNKINSLN